MIWEGPRDTSPLPKQSLGIILYNEIQRWDHNRIAIVNTNNEKVKYKKLWSMSVKMAIKLKSIGIKKNEVITIISHNQWKYVVTILAGLYIGAIVNPLSQVNSSGELRQLMSICKPNIVFCSTQTFKTLISLKTDPFYPKHIIIFDEETSGETNFDNFLNDVKDKKFAPVELDPNNDVAFIITTSGTTGPPKCVQLTHSNLRVAMVCCGDPNGLNIKPDVNVLGVIQICHIFGSIVVLASILYGAKLVIMEQFQPKLFLELIEKQKITRLYLIPPLVSFLAKHSIVENYDLSSVTDVVCTTAFLSRKLERKLANVLKIKSVRQAYGLTEVSGAVAIMPKNVKRYGSCGKVTSTHQLKVVNVETGKMSPPYELGELRVKGGGVMKGYLETETDTNAVFDENGFFKTADLGYYDERGLIYFVDQIHDIIKYKGNQVSPNELENILRTHSAVREVAVVPKPDTTSGEVPLAFVVKHLNVSVSEAQLVHYVAKNVGPEKRLHGGVIFIDAMPKSANGKILRRVLRQKL